MTGDAYGPCFRFRSPRKLGHSCRFACSFVVRKITLDFADMKTIVAERLQRSPRVRLLSILNPWSGGSLSRDVRHET